LETGYIKLWRSLKYNPVMQKPEYLSVWIYLLMTANYKESEFVFNDSKTVVKLGSFITSRAKIAINTGVQESKVERILKYLETEQQIEQQSFNKFRIISIVNWSKYQQTEQETEQLVNSKRTASEQQVNTYNKDKKDKKDNNIFIIPTLEEIKSYCRERKNQVNPQTFIDHYLSNGWLVGKNKMKDWKAAVRKWEQSNFGGTNGRKWERNSDGGDRIPKEYIGETKPTDAEIQRNLQKVRELTLKVTNGKDTTTP
jgi:hypothetical protein